MGVFFPGYISRLLFAVLNHGPQYTTINPFSFLS